MTTNSLARRIQKDNPFIDNIFKDLFKEYQQFSSTSLPVIGESSHPLVNVSNLKETENGTQYVIEFALAGYSRDEISSYVENIQQYGSTYKVLTVSVEPSKEDSMEYRAKEISRRKASRRVIIGINDEITDATYVDGILKFELTREDKESETRQFIDIK